MSENQNQFKIYKTQLNEKNKFTSEREDSISILNYVLVEGVNCKFL